MTSRHIKTELLRLGSDIVGFGNHDDLPNDVREGLPVGISIAVACPAAVICGIAELPTREYHDWYNKLNERLDMIGTSGAELLREMGYQAIAQTHSDI